MTFAERILKASSFDAKVSAPSDLEDFFCDFENQKDEIWPFDVSEMGYQPTYSKAYVVSDKFGFGKVLSLEAVCDKPLKSYIVSEDIALNQDKLEINLLSMYCREKEKTPNDGFVRRFIEKHYQFLKDWAKEAGVYPENAVVSIEAHSGVVNDVETRGGYVWATYGFDFTNVHELNQARICFKDFANKSGVHIALKDLAYFKHPCHFAAFCCEKDGQSRDLGKEFLMQYSWRGQMTACLSPKSEVYRYAKAYHEKSKALAEKELSKPFLKMMKQYLKPKKSRGIISWLLGAKKQRC